MKITRELIMAHNPCSTEERIDGFIKVNIQYSCRNCGCELSLEYNTENTQSLVFPLCQRCHLIETTWHECGNCQGTAAPGHELCHSCFETLKG